MLKRVVVIGRDGNFLDKLSAAADGQDAIVSGVQPGQGVPAGAGAVVAEGLEPGEVLCAAFGMAQRQESLLTLLSDAVDCRESFPSGSSVRVMEHATRLAAALGLSKEDQANLERAALLRDIGKLQIPNEVLLKDGILDYDDWLLLQKHPHIGAELAESIPDLDGTAEIIRHHHECFDGDGYPAKLDGDKIPYLSRALRILDVYCAMTSPRHYRQGHATHEEAIEHLKSERGKHFDPEIVDAFIEHDVGQMPA